MDKPKQIVVYVSYTETNILRQKGKFVQEVLTTLLARAAKKMTPLDVVQHHLAISRYRSRLFVPKKPHGSVAYYIYIDPDTYAFIQACRKLIGKGTSSTSIGVVARYMLAATYNHKPDNP